MKAFATFGLGSLGSISFHHAIQALPGDRPHGIAPDRWIRLDEKLGIVLDALEPAGNGMSGHLMVKHGEVWHRLNLDPR